jgi:hypothetical protein
MCSRGGSGASGCGATTIMINKKRGGMADTGSEAFGAFEARWEAIFARERAQFAAYDAGSPNLLDSLERLDGRIEALGHGAEERQRQQSQGMEY